jgi:hypothetical protein
VLLDLLDMISSVIAVKDIGSHDVAIASERQQHVGGTGKPDDVIALG